MKRQAILAIIIILFLFQAKAQITVKVFLRDETNRAVDFAVVALFKDTLLVKSDLSDSAGRCTFFLKRKDTIMLQTSCIGYNNNEIHIEVSSDTLISILMQKKSTEIKEVLVVAKVPIIERRADRLIVNVSKSIAATGGNALDALRVCPGVLIRNDQLKMAGKSGVKVMINNILIQMSGDELLRYLAAISSDNILKIEIISNPASNYDADGNSGLINIILKKPQSNYWNSRVRSSLIRNSYTGEKIGVDFSIQKRKTTFIQNLDLASVSKKITDQNKIYYPDQLWHTYSPRKVTLNSLVSSSELQYQIKPACKIGIRYLVNFEDLSVVKKNNTQLSKGSVLDSTLLTNSATNENSYLNAINTYLICNLDSLGKRIFMNLDYFHFTDHSQGMFENRNYDKYENPTNGGYYSANHSSVRWINNISGKIDLEQPIRKQGKLSYGLKYAFTSSKSDIKFVNTTTIPIVDTNATSIFSYSETNSALYSMYNHQFLTKWELQYGLRGEFTRTLGAIPGEESEYNYLKWFPSAFVSYTPNNMHSFIASYGKRINRPNYEQLNPLRKYTNPYSYVIGNPFVKPSFSENIEFTYAYKDFSSKIYYSRLKNGFQQLPIVDSTSRTQTLKILNFFDTDNLGLNTSYLFNNTQWLQASISIDIFYSLSRPTNDVMQSPTQYLNSYITFDNDIVFNEQKTFFGGLNFWYSFPGNDNLAKLDAFSQLDLSVKALFLNKQLVCTLVFQDIFKDNIAIAQLISNGVVAEYQSYYDTRSIRLSLSFNIGQSVIKNEFIDGSNNEEKRRIYKN